LLYCRMRGMRHMTQRVEKQNVETVQLLQRGGRNFAVIGEIGSRSATEAEDWSFSVYYRQRLEARAEKLDRSVDGMQIDERKSSEFIGRFEDVAEHGAKKFAGMWRGIERHPAGSVEKRQRAQVVDSENMVGVGVGVEHGIELSHVFAQRLFAKIGSAVDHHMASVVAEEDRRTGAAVARIGRTADGAVAADGGYPHRCAAAQYCQCRLHRVS
jgi:hypothetical protein